MRLRDIPEKKPSEAMTEKETKVEHISETEEETKTEENLFPEKMTEETEGETEEETTQAEIVEDSDQRNLSGAVAWVLLSCAAVGGVFSAVWLSMYKGRRICGNVSEAGGAAEHVLIAVKRTDIQDKRGVIKVYTDENGYYCLSKLKKGCYRLCVYHKDKKPLVLIDIDMR